MTYSAMELRAERSILRSMGLDATLKTYEGVSYSFPVLPVEEGSALSAGDYRGRESETYFETLAAEVPFDWRDSTLTVSGRRYYVLDVTFDEYGQRARIKVE